jgi:hypothetical protein
MGLQTDDFEQPPRISRAFARFGKSGKGCEARRLGHGAAVKYWELIANKLCKAGWSLGWVSAVDFEGERSGLPTHTAAIVKCFVVRADEKLTAFLGLESATRSRAYNGLS